MLSGFHLSHFLQRTVLTRRKRTVLTRRKTLLRSAKSDQRPVKRNQQNKNQKLDNCEPCAHANQVARREISVRVSDDKHPRLISEKLSACCKVPDHAQLQSISARALANSITNGMDVPNIEISLANRKW